MTEPADLSGLDFVVDMMRKPSPQELQRIIDKLILERDAYFNYIVKLGYAPEDALQEPQP